MDVKKNVRKVEKEVFDEIIICEECRMEIREDTEIKVNQNHLHYPEDEGDYRTFHFCDFGCLKTFLECQKKDVFKMCYPLGFYFTEEDVIKREGVA